MPVRHQVGGRPDLGRRDVLRQAAQNAPKVQRSPGTERAPRPGAGGQWTLPAERVASRAVPSCEEWRQ